MGAGHQGLGSGSAPVRGYDLSVSDSGSEPDNSNTAGSAIERANSSDLTTEAMPFESLTAPEPLNSAPPAQARWLGFAGIVLGGVLGGMIGWGTGDVLGQTTSWAAVGALIGAVFGALGVGIVASLTLRAMNEWHAVQHPEELHGIIGDAVASSTEQPTTQSLPTTESP